MQQCAECFETSKLQRLSTFPLVIQLSEENILRCKFRRIGAGARAPAAIRNVAAQTIMRKSEKRWKLGVQGRQQALLAQQSSGCRIANGMWALDRCCWTPGLNRTNTEAWFPIPWSGNAPYRFDTPHIKRPGWRHQAAGYWSVDLNAAFVLGFNAGLSQPFGDLATKHPEMWRDMSFCLIYILYLVPTATWNINDCGNLHLGRIGSFFNTSYARSLDSGTANGTSSSLSLGHIAMCNEVLVLASPAMGIGVLCKCAVEAMFTMSDSDLQMLES
jgi:hypothetical protein